MALRSTLHAAGAAALAQLLCGQEQPPERREIPCPCGHTARYRELRSRLVLAEDDRELGDALDRWELALFQDDPFRAEQLRHALEAALGDGDGTWAAGMRAAALLGETAQERADLVDRFRTPTLDLVRRLLVAVLLHGNRAKLLRELDQSLLGLRARPAGGVAELRAS